MSSFQPKSSTTCYNNTTTSQDENIATLRAILKHYDLALQIQLQKIDVGRKAAEVHCLRLLKGSMLDRALTSIANTATEKILQSRLDGLTARKRLLTSFHDAQRAALLERKRRAIHKLKTVLIARRRQRAALMAKAYTNRLVSGRK